MAETSPEEKAETNPESKTLLRPDMVNLVGESHDVSGPRQELEEKFVKAMIGSGAGYWTEYKFPAKQGEQAADQGERAADPMVYRGAQGAAEVISRFSTVCFIAGSLGYADSTGAAAVTKFLVQDVKGLINLKEKLDNSWDREQVPKSEQNDAVLKAVDEVSKFFKEEIDRCLQKTLDAIDAEDLKSQLQALRDLSDSGDAKLGSMAQQLSTAVESNATDADKLAEEMNARRSKSMALEATSSGLVGVWKVGDIHIKDLTEGMPEVDTSGINIVSEKDFNDAFEEWEKLQQQQPQQQAGAAQTDPVPLQNSTQGR
jgi:hypothetical protein